MTLDEFETWIINYPKGFISPITFERLDGDLNEFFNHFSNSLGEFSLNKMKEIINEKINDVEPIEDRDFLLLKYSEYL
jgi:hypothetical protein